ncbi:hypothetical protein [Nocardioides zeae]
MTGRRRAALAAVPLLALTGLTACSDGDEADAGTPGRSSATGTPEPGAGADEGPEAAARFAALPPSAVEAAVLEDMSTVTTVRARVQAVHVGLSVDAQVALDEDGDCLGTLAVDGGTAEVLRRGEGAEQELYGSFDATLLLAAGYSTAQADAAVAAAADRWVRLDPASDLADIALVCEAVEDARDARLLGGEDAATEITGLEQVDGSPVLGIERTVEAGTAALLVAATGDHRFVRLAIPREDEPAATVDELVYDEEVVVPDPASRGTVPAAELGLG